MYQEFTEQQLEIRDQIRNFVKKEITHEVAIHWDEENNIQKNSSIVCEKN